MGGSTLRGAGIAFGLASLMTLVLAAPVAVSPSTELFGEPIVGRHHDPFTVLEQFRNRWALGAYAQPATDWVGSALARIVGAVPAYNLVVLLSFPLAAAAAYLLARGLSLGHMEATIVGLLYAFAPFHLAHAAYHPHVAQTQWLPLYFLALGSCLRKPSPGRLAALGLAASLAALSNWYGGFIAAVLTPVALVGYAFIFSPGGRAVLRTSAALFTCAALGMAIALWRTPSLFSSASAYAFPRTDLFVFSAKWWSYLLPPVSHPVLGGAVRRFWADFNAASGVPSAADGLLEQQVTIGVGLLLLAAVAAGAWWREPRRGGSEPPLAWVPVLAMLAAAAALCSLSPERELTTFGATFRRPSHWLYELAPMFRAYARFASAAQLAVACLAGLGFAQLWRRGTKARALALVLLALAVFEYAPPLFPHRDVLPTSGHRFLAGLPDPVRLLECENDRPEDQSLRWLFPHELETLGQRFEDCDEPELAERLAALGYSHVLWRKDDGRTDTGTDTDTDTDAPPPPRAAPRAGFEVAAELEDSTVLRVAAAAPPAGLARLSGLHEREHRDGRSFRWSEGVVTWQLEARAGISGTSLEVELASWPHARQIVVTLNEARVAELAVGSSPSRFTIGPVDLRAGANRLVMTAEGRGEVADDVLHNGDTRTLSFTLGDWRWHWRDAR